MDLANSQVTANQFNNYFSSIAEKLQSSISPLKDGGQRLLDEALPYPHGQNNLNDLLSSVFYFSDVQSQELKTLIKSIEVHKSSGISSGLFKTTIKI